jgi:hypothetical protein
MDEYVLLAHQFGNEADDDSYMQEWRTGTFEQIAYYLEKLESLGYTCSVRRATHPLNNEFVKARIDKVVRA